MDDEFDPNEKIEVDASKEETEEPSLDDVKDLRKDPVDIKDFKVFATKNSVPLCGTYTFEIEQRFLREGTWITGLTSSISKSSVNAVRVTIFDGSIKLSTFNQSAFSEIVLPTKRTELPEGEAPVPSFIFDQSILAKVAQNFVAEDLKFAFDAERRILVISAGKTRLEFQTYTEVDFTDYHLKLSEPQYIAKVDTELLKAGIQYSKIFCKKDDTQLAFSLMDSKGAKLVAGNYTALGIFDSSLEDMGIKVKFEALEAFSKILGRFNAENTHIFSTETYFILRDENLYFGWETTNLEFPSVEGFLSDKSAKDFILVLRDQLLKSLKKLSVVSRDKDTLVKIGVSGKGNTAKMILSIKDASGKTSRDEIKILRQSIQGETSEFMDQECYVNMAGLIEIVSHFTSVNCNIRLALPKAVFILDSGEKFKTLTAMVLTSQEK